MADFRDHGFSRRGAVMFTIMSASLLVAASASGGPSDPRCDLGQIAVADVASRDALGEYIETDPTRSALMRLCPQLGRNLPKGAVAANDEVRSRAGEHVPKQGEWRAPASIYTIGVPVIAADGRSATVEITSECTGLCGMGKVSRYVRTDKGWRRDGGSTVLWIS